MADEEDQNHEPHDFKKVDSEKVKRKARKINRIFKGNKETYPKKWAKAGYTENNFPPNLEAYSQQEEILQDRNSYSRTDPDATFIADEE